MFTEQFYSKLETEIYEIKLTKIKAKEITNYDKSEIKLLQSENKNLNDKVSEFNIKIELEKHEQRKKK